MDHLFRRHVEKHDPAMFKIIVDHPVLTLPTRRPAFEAIVRTVAGQQLSTKAAAKICSRLEMALGGQISPQSTLEVDIAALRLAGLSNAKAYTIISIAEFAGCQGEHLERLLMEPWDEVRTSLLSIKGVGPWSVDMFAMFGLGLTDVFSSGDLGLRTAMEKHLHIPRKQKPAVYDQRALLWSPYRTLASLHLWHSLKPSEERFR